MNCFITPYFSFLNNFCSISDSKQMMCQKRKCNQEFEHPAVWILTWKPLPDITVSEMRTELGGLLVIDKIEHRCLPHSYGSITSFMVAERLWEKVYILQISRIIVIKCRERQGLLKLTKQRAYRLPNCTVSSRIRIKLHSYVTLYSVFAHLARWSALEHRLLRHETDTYNTLEIINKHIEETQITSLSQSTRHVAGREKQGMPSLCAILHVIGSFQWSSRVTFSLSTLALLRRLFK